MTDEATARLEALLEAHGAIAEDIGAEKVLAQNNPSDHLAGEREALRRVEELIVRQAADVDTGGGAADE